MVIDQNVYFYDICRPFDCPSTRVDLSMIKRKCIDKSTFLKHSSRYIIRICLIGYNHVFIKWTIIIIITDIIHNIRRYVPFFFSNFFHFLFTTLSYRIRYVEQYRYIFALAPLEKIKVIISERIHVGRLILYRYSLVINVERSVRRSRQCSRCIIFFSRGWKILRKLLHKYGHLSVNTKTTIGRFD